MKASQNAPQSSLKFHTQFDILKPNEIVRNDWNPNFVPSDIMNAIVDDIQQNGFIGTIVLQKYNKRMKKKNVIINGEHRYEALTRLGSEHIPSTIIDVSDTVAQVLTLRLNREHGHLLPDKIFNILQAIDKELDIETLNKMTAISPEELRVLANLEIAEVATMPQISESKSAMQQFIDASQYAEREATRNHSTNKKEGNITLSWAIIEAAAVDIAQQLERLTNDATKENTVIVAIANGGLIPAKLVSEVMKIDRIAIMPKIPKPMPPKWALKNILAASLNITDRIIIIDDIYDKGVTYSQATNFIYDITSDKVNVDFAVLVMKPNRNEVNPQIISAINTNSKRWVVFPWEELSLTNQ